MVSGGGAGALLGGRAGCGGLLVGYWLRARNCGSPGGPGAMCVMWGCNIMMYRVCGCFHVQSGAWLLAPCRAEDEEPQGFLIIGGWERGEIMVDLGSSRM